MQNVQLEPAKEWQQTRRCSKLASDEAESKRMPLCFHYRQNDDRTKNQGNRG